MNTKSLKFLVIVVASLGLGACGGGSSSVAPPVVSDPPTPPDPVVPPETTPPLSFFVSGSVVDPDEFGIEDVSLTFRHDGALATDIVDVNGEAFSTLESADGSFTFTLAEGASIDTLRIRARSEGFLDRVREIDLSTTTDDLDVVITMQSASAAGVAKQATSAPLTSGATSSDVQASASTGSSSAVVSVAGATELRGPDGTAVPGSSVEVSVTAVDGEGEGAIAADLIPPGLDEAIAAATGDSDTVQSIVGATDIVMEDDLGNPIVQFSQPISITVESPNDGSIAEGDTLTLSSYDAETDTWSKEPSDATVGPLNANGNFDVTFTTDHLTIYTWTTGSPRCGIESFATFEGAAPIRGLQFNIFSSDRPAGQFVYSVPTNGEPLRYASVGGALADDATGSVRVFDKAGNNWFLSDGEIPLCGGITVALEDPAPQRIDETLSVNAVCSNDSSVVQPILGAVVQYKRSGRGARPASANGDGTYPLSAMIDGETYELIINPRISDLNGPVTPVAPSDRPTIVADGTDDTVNISVACAGGTGGG